MNRAKLFFLTMVAGGAGAVLGSIVGNAFGRGGVFTGGVIGGAAFVAGAGALATAWGWISRRQRPWVIAGGLVGLGLACLVALSTLSSPVGPFASTLLIGTGAVLGAVFASSPHGDDVTGSHAES